MTANLRMADHLITRSHMMTFALISLLIEYGAYFNITIPAFVISGMGNETADTTRVALDGQLYNKHAEPKSS